MKLTKNHLLHALADIDRLVHRQLELILCHSNFQDLYRVWLQLNIVASSSHQKIFELKLLNLTWEEVAKDINTSSDIEITNLFSLIHELEFGSSGGNPFGILWGQYSLNINLVKTTSTLSRLAEIAMHSLVPFISNVSAATFGEPAYDKVKNMTKSLDLQSSSSWSTIRGLASSQFINLLMPDCKISIQYKNDSRSILIDSSIFLILRIRDTFLETSWFNDILGGFDPLQLLNTGTADYKITKVNALQYLKYEDEQACINIGFMPLLQQGQDNLMHFACTYSINKYAKTPQLLLEHLLCACRFGHYIKIMIRNKIGVHSTIDECENHIQNWLRKYTANISKQTHRAAYPLKKFKVKLTDIPGKPGYFSCNILLEPHMKLETLNSEIILYSEITPF
jgi:type VI secretion system protein ImpD